MTCRMSYVTSISSEKRSDARSGRASGLTGERLTREKRRLLLPVFADDEIRVLSPVDGLENILI